jgi:hypothetical protein
MDSSLPPFTLSVKVNCKKIIFFSGQSIKSSRQLIEEQQPPESVAFGRWQLLNAATQIADFLIEIGCFNL